MTTKRIKQLKDLMIRARANASESLAEMLRALNERRSVVDTIVDSHNRMEKIDAALARMANGRYGLCIDCGDDIGEGRLIAQPWAEACAACQKHREATMLDQMPQDFKMSVGRPLDAARRA